MNLATSLLSIAAIVLLTAVPAVSSTIAAIESREVARFIECSASWPIGRRACCPAD